MSMKFLFTSECVSGGHPDKLCDYVSDSVLDACLKVDPNSLVAIETAAKGNLISILGEVSCNGEVNFEQVIRQAAKYIGYDSIDVGLDYKTAQVLICVDKQSSEIANSVHVGKNDEELGAGDQGLMIGYATDETPELLPLSYTLSCKILQRFDNLRRDGTLSWVRPDMKSQVTVEYERDSHGVIRPIRIDTILVSIQHNDDVSNEQIKTDSIEQVFKHCIPEEFKNDNIRYIVNPSGSFVRGGPFADAGVTGRKIIVDTYGGWGGHGGGAFSGKDATKVDRSGAYAARWIAKSLVHNKLCNRCMVQVAYGIGLTEPVSIYVETYGTAAEGYTDADLCTIVKEHFDLRPGMIIKQFNMRRPIFTKTTLYGHFMKTDPDCAWESPKDLSSVLKK